MNLIKLEKKFHKETDFGTSDVFCVFINGFNDGQQDFQFLSMLMGNDCITTDTNGEDYSWDAIWKNKAIITFGWVVEMRFPTRYAFL
jgi:hypothetical protein